MSCPLCIFADIRCDSSTEEQLRAGIAPHQLIRPSASISVLSSGDASLNGIDIAFGQPGGFPDEARLGQIRPSAILYNIGRGTTVDQTALAHALCPGRIAQALAGYHRSRATSAGPPSARPGELPYNAAHRQRASTGGPMPGGPVPRKLPPQHRRMRSERPRSLAKTRAMQLIYKGLFQGYLASWGQHMSQSITLYSGQGLTPGRLNIRYCVLAG